MTILYKHYPPSFYRQSNQRVFKVGAYGFSNIIFGKYLIEHFLRDGNDVVVTSQSTDDSFIQLFQLAIALPT